MEKFSSWNAVVAMGRGMGRGLAGSGREPRPPAVLGILNLKSVGLREAKSSFFMIRQQFFVGSQMTKADG